jgi:hypothetical protein
VAGSFFIRRLTCDKSSKCPRWNRKQSKAYIAQALWFAAKRSSASELV